RHPTGAWTRSPWCSNSRKLCTVLWVPLTNDSVDFPHRVSGTTAPTSVQHLRVRRLRLVSGLLGASLLAPACSSQRSRAVVGACPSGTASLVPEEVASEEIAASILSNVFEPLVSFEGNLALQPGLAESWYTEDQLTWVFKLRRGVRFQDGRQLD